VCSVRTGSNHDTYNDVDCLEWFQAGNIYRHRRAGLVLDLDDQIQRRRLCDAGALVVRALL